MELALKAHRLLGIEGYSRTDFILPADGMPSILEVNTLPGMTATSLIPQEAAAVGLSFGDFIEGLLALGMQRQP
jgi:D-alanine-D-alanine ligase